MPGWLGSIVYGIGGFFIIAFGLSNCFHDWSSKRVIWSTLFIMFCLPVAYMLIAVTIGINL